MTPLEETVSSDERYEPRRPPWRALAIAAVVILLGAGAIFLPPLINLGKYRRSITASMSEALGRPVYAVSYTHLDVYKRQPKTSHAPVAGLSARFIARQAAPGSP